MKMTSNLVHFLLSRTDGANIRARALGAVTESMAACPGRPSAPASSCSLNLKSQDSSTSYGPYGGTKFNKCTKYRTSVLFTLYKMTSG